MIVKVNNKNIILCLLIFLLIFSSIMSNYITFFGFTDEFLSLFFLIYLFFKKSDYIYSYKMLLFLKISVVIIIFLGIISNLYNTPQISWKYIIIDIVMALKPISYLAFGFLFANKKSLKDISGLLRRPVYLLIIIFLFLAVVSQFTNIGMSDDNRYGISSFKFIYGYAGDFGNIVIACVVILFWRSLTKKTLTNNIFIFFGIIVIFLTTKFQNYIFCVIIGILIIFQRVIKKNNTITYLFIFLLCLLLALFFGSYQIKTYFLDESLYSPRRLFLSTSFLIAKTYFPLGTGFASFGSEMAAKNYSPIYVLYNFSNLYGLTSENGFFLKDTFLPMILGQFGFIGFAVYYNIYCFFCFLIKKVRDIRIKNIEITIMVTLLVASIGSGLIATTSGETIAFLLGITIRNGLNVAEN